MARQLSLLPDKPKECPGSYRAPGQRWTCNRAPFITDELEHLGVERCKIKVPKDKTAFNRQGRRIFPYWRACTPDELRSFVWRNDEWRAPLIADINEKMDHYINIYGPDETEYEETLIRAFNDVLGGGTHYGDWRELIPEYYRYKFWKETGAKKLKEYYKDVPDSDEGFDEDNIYSYFDWRDSSIAEAFDIWFGKNAVKTLLELPPGWESWIKGQVTSFPKEYSPLYKSLTSRAKGRPSLRTESKEIAKKYGIDLSKVKNIRDVYDAIEKAAERGNPLNNPTGQRVDIDNAKYVIMDSLPLHGAHGIFGTALLILRRWYTDDYYRGVLQSDGDISIIGPYALAAGPRTNPVDLGTILTDFYGGNSSYGDGKITYPNLKPGAQVAKLGNVVAILYRSDRDGDERTWVHGIEPSPYAENKEFLKMVERFESRFSVNGFDTPVSLYALPDGISIFMQPVKFSKRGLHE